MEKSKLKLRIQNFLAIFILLFFAGPVFASQIFFEAKKTEIGVGEKIEVNLFINSEKEAINAYEAKILFSNDILNVKEIRDGNSIVNFWIEKPRIEDGQISFSGITPGGFKGEKGLILSIILEAKKEGLSKFEIKDARVLRNDGTGSEVSLLFVPFELLVSKEIPTTTTAIPETKDTEPPESFVPEIARDETLFGGKWFLVFATQDKGSGIDHYEVKEWRAGILSKVFSIKYLVFRGWEIAESPYVLRDQKLRSYIFVKAVDKAGNERIAKLPPQNPLKWYENWLIWVIIIIIGVFIVWRKLKVKNEKRKITI